MIRALAFLMLIGTAQAHDASRPDLNSWFGGLRNGGGALCCSGPDGEVVLDSDWESKDGHYRVKLEGEWVDVPDSSVVKSPNLDGRTIVWPRWINGKPEPRCFMPGSMT